MIPDTNKLNNLACCGNDVAELHAQDEHCALAARDLLAARNSALKKDVYINLVQHCIDLADFFTREKTQ